MGVSRLFSVCAGVWPLDLWVASGIAFDCTTSILSTKTTLCLLARVAICILFIRMYERLSGRFCAQGSYPLSYA